MSIVACKCGQLYDSTDPKPHVCFVPAATQPPIVEPAPTRVCAGCGDILTGIEVESHVCPTGAELGTGVRPKLLDRGIVVVRTTGIADLIATPVTVGFLDTDSAIECEVRRRVEAAAELWPTLESAFGCLGCGRLYRHLNENGSCCHCGSQATFDAASTLNGTGPGNGVRVRLEGMSRRLEAVLDDKSRSEGEANAIEANVIEP